MSDGTAWIRVDQLLLRAGRGIALIERCRPLNTRAELERLTERWEAGETAAPEFRYAPASDLAETRRALGGVAERGAREAGLGRLYAGRGLEPDHEAAIVEALGSLEFASRAARRYSIREHAAVRVASRAARWAVLSPRGEPGGLAGDNRDPR